MFEDHPGEGIIIRLRYISRMRIEKAEVLWTYLRFESKTASHQFYDDWVQKFLAIPGVTGKIMKVGVKRALGCSRLLPVTKHHQDLEFLISCWSVKSLTFVGALEDVMNITALPLYAMTKAMGMVFRRG